MPLSLPIGLASLHEKHEFSPFYRRRFPNRTGIGPLLNCDISKILYIYNLYMIKIKE